MDMRKKLPVLVSMCLMSCLTLTACGNNTTDKNTASTEKAAEEAAPAAVETAESSESPEAAETDVEPEEEVIEETETEVLEDTVDEAVPEVIYAPVLDEIRDIRANGYDETKEYQYCTTGIMEAAMYSGEEDLLNELGMKFLDLNGDGKVELLIGMDNYSFEDGTPGSSNILAGYSYDDENINTFLEGWGRSSYQWMDNGSFFYFGSGGAAISIFGECYLGADGKQLVWKDYYFSDGDDEGNLSFYHNNTGEFDKENSEKLDMSDEEFWAMPDNYKCANIGWDPIPDNGAGAQDASGAASAVTAVWADEVPENNTEYILYENQGTEDSNVDVIFSVTDDVNNFRIVELFTKNIDDDGNIEFEYEDRYSVDVLTPETPLCAGLTFAGTIPNNGFMYTDENGKDRLFVLSESGKDGSLIMWEYEGL